MEKNKYKKIRSDLELILEGQKINQKDFRLRSIGLAKQNCELLNLNKKLTEQLDSIVKKLDLVREERDEKAALKQARAN